MGRVRRRCAQRPLDHGGDLIVVDRARSAGASFVEQPVDTTSQEAPTPLADRMLVTPSSVATTLLCKPSAQRKIIRHRSESERDTRCRRTCRSRYARSSAVTNNGSVGRPFENTFAIDAPLSENALYNVTYFSSRRLVCELADNVSRGQVPADENVAIFPAG